MSALGKCFFSFVEEDGVTQRFKHRKIIKFGILRFWFWGDHFGYCRQEKKYFAVRSTMNMKKISWKLEKMAFYVVILTMFQITVFRSILINADYILRYLDRKVFRFHFNHSPELSGFFRKGRPSLRPSHAFFTFRLQFHEVNGTKLTYQWS